MSKESRRVKLEKDLALLESTFRARLLAALRACAAGHWGLFGRNNDVLEGAYGSNHKYISNEAQDLLSLGGKIDDLRARLGYTEGYALYGRFLAARNDRSPNTIGEPKQAQRFLDEISSEHS